MVAKVVNRHTYSYLCSAITPCQIMQTAINRLIISPQLHHVIHLHAAGKGAAIKIGKAMCIIALGHRL